jgi:8-oxo-dGTP diphosphatase
MSEGFIGYALALLINKNNEILISYRTHSASFNDQYGLIGGKIDPGELAKQALARELYEEVGIIVAHEDMQFVHVMNFIGETQPCVVFFFSVHLWQGFPYNNEPKKIGYLKWVALNQIPDNFIPRQKIALEYITQSIYYSELC